MISTVSRLLQKAGSLPLPPAHLVNKRATPFTFYSIGKNLLMTSTLLVFHGLLLGSMLFFAAVVAPSVFKFVSAEQAGQFLRGIFPRYYLWGIVVSLIMVGLASMVSSLVLLSSIAVLALFFLARQVLMPAINDARDQMLSGDSEAKTRFNRLHGVSVAINLLQMLILIAVAMHLAW
jgi:uncharacterized membrane protein